MLPRYQSRGDGSIAVLMLHGVGGGAAAWAPQLESFAAAGYRAVAWDAPGYGDSPAIEPYDMAGLAAAARALIEHLAPARVVVMGHSMGGMVAQELVALHPDAVAGLVLSATSAAFGKPDGDWQREFLAQRLAPLDAGSTMADLAPRLVAGFVGEDPDPAGVRRAVEVMSRVPPDTYRKALQAIVGFDRRAALSSIRVPVLAIAGERDETAPPAVMSRMADRIADAQYVQIGGCGHLANLERPQAFDAALLEWLARRFPLSR